MIKIAEKLGFMKVRAVMVYAKAGIGRKLGHKKPCFSANLKIMLPRKLKSLIFRGNLDMIIDIGKTEQCL